MGMTIDEALEIIKRDDNDMRKGYFCINDFKAIETLVDCGKKYQKIQEIVKEWREVGLEYDSCDAMMNIERVVKEDGNDD